MINCFMLSITCSAQTVITTQRILALDLIFHIRMYIFQLNIQNTKALVDKFVKRAIVHCCQGFFNLLAQWDSSPFIQNITKTKLCRA